MKKVENKVTALTTGKGLAVAVKATLDDVCRAVNEIVDIVNAVPDTSEEPVSEEPVSEEPVSEEPVSEEPEPEVADNETDTEEESQ